VVHAHESSNEDLPRGKGTKPAAVSRKTRPVAGQSQQQPFSAGAQAKAPKVYARSKPANGLSAHAEEEAAPAAEAAAKRAKAAVDQELSAEQAEQKACAKQGREKTGQQRAAAAKRPVAAHPAAHGGGGKSEAVADAASSGGSGEEGDGSSDDSSSEDEYQPTQKGKRQRAKDGHEVYSPPMAPMHLRQMFLFYGEVRAGTGLQQGPSTGNMHAGRYHLYVKEHSRQMWRTHELIPLLARSSA